MKHLIFVIAVAATFSGCEVLHRPGIIVRDKVTVAGKYGPVEKTADMISLNADIPGLSEIPTPYGPIKIAQVSGQSTRLIIDPKTKAVLGTETITTLGGLAVTEHVGARGVADRFRIKETSS